MFSPRALKWEARKFLKRKKLGLLPARPQPLRLGEHPWGGSARGRPGRERSRGGGRGTGRGYLQRGGPDPAPHSAARGPAAGVSGGLKQGPGPSWSGRGHHRARGPRRGGPRARARARAQPFPALRPPRHPTPQRAAPAPAGPGRVCTAPRGSHLPPSASAAAPFGLPPPGTHLLRPPVRPPAGRRSRRGQRKAEAVRAAPAGGTNTRPAGTSANSGPTRGAHAG